MAQNHTMRGKNLTLRPAVKQRSKSAFAQVRGTGHPPTPNSSGHAAVTAVNSYKTPGQSTGHPTGQQRSRHTFRPHHPLERVGAEVGQPRNPFANTQRTSPRNGVDRPRIVIPMTEAARVSEQNGDRDRDAALAVYLEHGLAEATRRTGLPKSTLRRWAANAGLDPATIAGATAERTAAATAAKRARCDELRADLQEEFLLVAAEALERTRHPYIEFVGVKGEQVEYPLPPAGATFQLVKTAATALDKFRLEAGEATDRTEVVGVSADEAREQLARVVDMQLARAS